MTIGLASNQNQPDLTVNQMGHDYLVKSVAGGSDVVLTDFEATYAQIELTGVLTASINLEQADSENMIWIHNNTTGAFTVTVRPTGGSGIVVAQGTRAKVGFDGAGSAVDWTSTGTGVSGPVSSTVNNISTWGDGSGSSLLDTGVTIDTDDNIYGMGSKLRKVTGSITVGATDNGKIIFVDSASAVNVTLPETSTESLPEGYSTTIIQKGDGEVTFVVEGSDTLLSRNSENKLVGKGSMALAIREDNIADVWFIGGDTTT